MICFSVTIFPITEGFHYHFIIDKIFVNLWCLALEKKIAQGHYKGMDKTDFLRFF